MAGRPETRRLGTDHMASIAACMTIDDSTDSDHDSVNTIAASTLLSPGVGQHLRSARVMPTGYPRARSPKLGPPTHASEELQHYPREYEHAAATIASPPRNTTVLSGLRVIPEADSFKPDSFVRSPSPGQFAKSASR